MENKILSGWEKSYKQKQNFLLYPSEHIIRFFNKYIEKKKTLSPKPKKLNALDFGCGIGRHIAFFEENGVRTVGYDISENAIKTARIFLKKKKIKNISLTNSLNHKFLKKKFDIIVSYGVLDAMSLINVKKSLDFIYKKLNKNSLFIVELLGNKSMKRKGIKLSKYECLVKEKHEYNTIQLYHNWKLIKNLYNKFKVIEKIETFIIKKKYKHHEYIIVFKKK